MPEYSKTRFESKDGRAWIRVIDQLPMRDRYLHFGTSIQGVLNLDNMGQPVLEYIGLMAELGKAAMKQPDKILIGGLGACALWHACRAWRGPRCELVVVEQNPLVIELAKSFFRFTPEPTLQPESLRAFLAEHEQKYELLFVDCYNARFMPAELLSAEFMALLKLRMSEAGAAVLNVWNPTCNKICGHQIRTILEVFGHVGIVAGKEDDNFALLLPGDKLGPLPESVDWKGRTYWVNWVSLENSKRWPDYLGQTQVIYDGNVWRYMREFKE